MLLDMQQMQLHQGGQVQHLRQSWNLQSQRALLPSWRQTEGAASLSNEESLHDLMPTQQSKSSCQPAVLCSEGLPSSGGRGILRGPSRTHSCSFPQIPSNSE